MAWAAIQQNTQYRAGTPVLEEKEWLQVEEQMLFHPSPAAGQTHRSREVEWWLPAAEGRGDGELWVVHSRHKISVMQDDQVPDLLYYIVLIINNAVLDT